MGTVRFSTSFPHAQIAAPHVGRTDIIHFTRRAMRLVVLLRGA